MKVLRFLFRSFFLTAHIGVVALFLLSAVSDRISLSIGFSSTNGGLFGLDYWHSYCVGGK